MEDSAWDWLGPGNIRIKRMLRGALLAHAALAAFIIWLGFHLYNSDSYLETLTTGDMVRLEGHFSRWGKEPPSAKLFDINLKIREYPSRFYIPDFVAHGQTALNDLGTEVQPGDPLWVLVQKSQWPPKKLRHYMAVFALGSGPKTYLSFEAGLRGYVKNRREGRQMARYAALWCLGCLALYFGLKRVVLR